MPESQSDAAHKMSPSGDARTADATAKLHIDPEVYLITEAGRGSRHRGKWPLPPAVGNAISAGPAGARPRMAKKSAWTLGSIIAIAVLAVVLSAVARVYLSGGKTPLTMAVAASSTSPRASGPARRPVKSAREDRVPSASARPPSARTRPGKTASPAPASAAAASATAPAQVTPGPQPATTASAAPSAAGQPVSMSVPNPVSWWYLNDDAGMTARDATGANPASGSNISWCTSGNGNCATFNGTSSQFTTSGPVLNTAPGSSFTVSAWVYLTAYTPNGFETIVSQDGAYDSGFYLQYSGTDHRWAFARVVADTAQGPAGIRALSVAAPSLSTWTHLVGVFDATDDQLRLYVNGVLQGTAIDPTPFAANGRLAIGRGQFGGHPTDWFDGAANQVKVYNVALTSTEVADI
jgi:hypothetical protein